MHRLSQPTIPFTAQAYAAKQAELDRLLQRRQRVMDSLILARDAGDLSENEAYHAAKFELGGIGRQLRAVRHLLANGYIAPVSHITNVADFGRTVTIKSDQKALTFLLVSEHESNPVENKLSLQSPIGQAVLGKQAGDQITITTPRGQTKYTIIKVN